MAATRDRLPSILVKSWWALRDGFRRTMPTEVNEGYLVTLMGVGGKAARNLLPDLRRVGLIDEDGCTTQLATRWRDDSEYAAVCGEILGAVYPSELRDAVPPESPDRSKVLAWLKRDPRVGDSAAQKKAAFYLLLCAADPTGSAKRSASTRASSGRRASQRGDAPATKVARAGGTSDARTAAAQPGVPEATEPGPAGGSPATQAGAASSTGVPLTAAQQLPRREAPQIAMPALHIDLQIHIDASATADQIDQIFASMAKHLHL